MNLSAKLIDSEYRLYEVMSSGNIKDNFDIIPGFPGFVWFTQFCSFDVLHFRFLTDQSVTSAFLIPLFSVSQAWFMNCMA